MTNKMQSHSDYPSQWRLDRIELVNWGTFGGNTLHVIDIARKGFLLTGESGSGKSSLVDAITAVLTPRRDTRFNAAAADGAGRSEDRSVLSYVRGAWRRAADSDTGEIATQYLRSGATWSGILLRYRSGTGAKSQTITLVKLFHVKRGASTAAEVREVQILLTEPVGLLDFQPFARDGLDIRGIKRNWPKASVFQEHSRFAAKFTRALGITGDRAILLLHKTQSAKNLGSLDELFRGFMLDEPETFAIADRAVEQFAELSEAHEAVVQATQQVEHLAPLTELAATYDQAVLEVQQTDELAAELEDFTRAWKLQLVEKAHGAAQGQAVQLEEEVRQAQSAVELADTQVRDAQSLIDQRGGARLEALEAQIAAAKSALGYVRRERERWSIELDDVGIALPQTVAELAELQRTAAVDLAAQAADQQTMNEEAHELSRERAVLLQETDRITGELGALRSSQSNVGKRLNDARAIVAKATGIPVASLPYVAELIEVRSEYADWTGAIERVLRPFASVLLVPAAREFAVAAAVDATHLGAHLKIEAVPAGATTASRPTSPESLLYRVDLRDHPMHDWLYSELVRRFDFRCVETAGDLVACERGVTRAGQVKRGKRSYDKDDRFAVDDRTRWVLGFDNAAKIDHYLDLLRAGQQRLATTDAELARLERRRVAHQDRSRVLARIGLVQWADIDEATITASLAEHQAARARLLAADGDLRNAHRQLAEASSELAQARRRADTVREQFATARAEVANLAETLAELSDQTSQVPPEAAELLAVEFRAVRSGRSVTHQSIDGDSTKVLQALNKRVRVAMTARNDAYQKIAALEAEFRRNWPALASELTADPEDRDGYLQILAELRADRLPEFEQRFFDLLQDQSQKNVGLLAKEIRSAPKEIRRRVDPINSSLLRSQFAPGRYLQIQVDEARPAVVNDFLRDLQTIASGALMGTEERPEAEARFAVLSRVMHQLSSSEAADRSWRSQCLDTRRHVKFVGREVDSDGAVVDVYDSGAGRSGGQKQKLVVFCLAAALRYQLARDDESVPAFGSVVMDEAFDKADANFTKMALDIFREFGFHLILATPLKLLQTLEDYVGGIALVTCRNSKDSRIASVPFDELPRSDDANGASGPDRAAAYEVGIDQSVVVDRLDFELV